ncbi:MAG: sensor histidine kinase [Pseudonocardia sp.]
MSTRPALAHRPGRARVLLLLVTCAFLVPAPTFALLGPDAHGPAPVVAAAGIGALHLRHALATPARPAGWPVTLAALVALVYAPAAWWGFAWASIQWFVVGSVAVLLPARQAVIAGSVPVVGTMAVAWWVVAAELGPLAPASLTVALYWLAGLVFGGIALYGAARLVAVLDQLDAARAELADAAVGQERLRLSRDLHDLLGQSLSALSLKGDLALALLHTDPAAARAEIESLTGVARDALRGIRAVTRDEHDLSLDAECAGAAALLAVELPGPVPRVEALLAWAVREGVTNVLRHSDARSCSIHCMLAVTSVRLEIVNDLPRPATDAGTGLAGLADRARALGGDVTTTCTGEIFRMVVDVPREAP